MSAADKLDAVEFAKALEALRDSLANLSDAELAELSQVNIIPTGIWVHVMTERNRIGKFIPAYGSLGNYLEFHRRLSATGNP